MKGNIIKYAQDNIDTDVIIPVTAEAAATRGDERYVCDSI